MEGRKKRKGVSLGVKTSLRKNGRMKKGRRKEWKKKKGRRKERKNERRRMQKERKRKGRDGEKGVWNMIGNKRMRGFVTEREGVRTYVRTSSLSGRSRSISREHTID